MYRNSWCYSQAFLSCTNNSYLIAPFTVYLIVKAAKNKTPKSIMKSSRIIKSDQQTVRHAAHCMSCEVSTLFFGLNMKFQVLLLSKILRTNQEATWFRPNCFFVFPFAYSCYNETQTHKQRNNPALVKYLRVIVVSAS